MTTDDLRALLNAALPWLWCQDRIYDVRDAIFFWRKYTR